MLKFFKPARGKDIHQRGYFSYITESVLNLHNVLLNYPKEEIKIYYNLVDIPGYGNGNVYDVCFEQDIEDFLENKEEYVNIESVNYITSLEIYNQQTYNTKIREECERLIKNHIKIKSDLDKSFSLRQSQIDFTKTIGFHRRATDMQSIHGFKTIDLSHIFSILEKEEFENIFLMSDNIQDLMKFKNRYGNKLITFDETTTSQETNNPFFKVKNDELLIENHIREIVFGAYTLGMTKKLFCTNSNLSAFSILSNSKLNYTILN
jgi:hypothetical protein